MARIDLTALILGDDVSKDELQAALWPGIYNRHMAMQRYESGQSQLNEGQLRNLLYLLRDTDLTFATLPLQNAEAGRHKPIYPHGYWPRTAQQ